MKDLTQDPRVQALPETVRNKFVKKAEEAQAAILWDAIAEEYAEANEARTYLPTIKAEMTALRRAVERPQNVTLAQPKPATANKPQRVLPASRLLAANVVAHMMHKLGGNNPETNLLKLLPGDEHRIARKLAKSATVPGSTTAASWGAELVQSDVGAFYRSLKERSAVAQLAELGTNVDFGGNANITFPHRGANDDGSLKPAFVQERATIPVSSATLASTMMGKYKLGIITIATDELIRVSNILDVMEQMIQDDVAEGLDFHVLDPTSTAIPAVRPAAITVGAPNQASAGATLDNVLADIRYLRGQLSNARRPAIIMHSDHMRALEMLQVDGRFPLAAMVASGDLWGLTLIHSPFVTKGIVVGVDAAAYYHASDLPELDTSSAATVALASAQPPDPQMTATGATEDAVDDLGGSIHVSDAAGTVPATKVVSTFQTNSVAMRMVHPLTWTTMPNSVAYLTGVAWG
ncbi:phage major capsid protein [Ruegeria sp. HKCCA4633]|uniref:phage major capsid protein n=1 Tax=Ruegeria sp. HKCCA4633 TaxID=2682983 RepID=UPI001487A5CC|nr:phage major capsid protein [Ruegeria sp. HKCCA4633]